jgi:hypothetical protein
MLKENEGGRADERASGALSGFGFARIFCEDYLSCIFSFLFQFNSILISQRSYKCAVMTTTTILTD